MERVEVGDVDGRRCFNALEFSEEDKPHDFDGRKVLKMCFEADDVIVEPR